MLFENKQSGTHTDVFLDKLDMNHKINFSKRLEHDDPTVPLAELLLSKLQVVKLNEKDIVDMIVLLLEHELGEDGRDNINRIQISEYLSRDWGFYHTVEINLQKLEASLEGYSSFLTHENKRVIISKVENLKEVIERKPKSFGWKIRARSGESINWYEEVEEVYR